MSQIIVVAFDEEIPEVEISLSKVLDGQPTIYQMAMGTGALVSLANNRCGVRLLLYPDTNTTADGVPIAAVELSKKLSDIVF
jgi:hypothetical protein